METTLDTNPRALNSNSIRQGSPSFSTSGLAAEQIAEFAGALRLDQSRTAAETPPNHVAAEKIGAAARRGFDVACAALGLVFLAPVFAVIAAAIKLEDGGPVYYTQMRVGKEFKMFRLFKFRSMSAGSPEGAVLTGPDDPRVTRVGRYLRKCKLDELPQLLNVVNGDMQLVGVRLQTERFVQVFPFEYSVLLQEPPGITGLASLAFRNEERMFGPGPIEQQYLEQILPEKLRLALEYRMRRTFLSDIGIICRTVLGFKSPANR